MSITERLRAYMKDAGLNINQVTVRCGLRPGTLNKALKVGKSLNSDTVAAILTHYPDLNAEWLLMGYGPMRRKVARVVDMNSGREIPPEEQLEKADRLERWRREKVGPPPALAKQLTIQEQLAELLVPENLELLHRLIEERKAQDTD